MPEDGKCYLSRLDPARCCKSGGGEGGLFHQDITFESGVTMTFAEIP